jgi:hypothetical protein
MAMPKISPLNTMGKAKMKMMTDSLMIIMMVGILVTAGDGEGGLEPVHMNEPCDI